MNHSYVLCCLDLISSFVGEIAGDRWSIAHNRHYFWEKNFHRICDYNSIKEILEYTGRVHQLRRWLRNILDMILVSFIVLLKR